MKRVSVRTNLVRGNPRWLCHLLICDYIYTKRRQTTYVGLAQLGERKTEEHAYTLNNIVLRDLEVTGSKVSRSSLCAAADAVTFADPSHLHPLLQPVADTTGASALILFFPSPQRRRRRRRSPGPLPRQSTRLKRTSAAAQRTASAASTHWPAHRRRARTGAHTPPVVAAAAASPTASRAARTPRRLLRRRRALSSRCDPLARGGSRGNAVRRAPDARRTRGATVRSSVAIKLKRAADAAQVWSCARSKCARVAAVTPASSG